MREGIFAETAAPLRELHAHLVLEPDKVYHYRVVAENADGSFETPDATVQTYPASQGALPDGRAYEQVSPVDKNHVDALGVGEYMSMQASPDGSSFAYFSYEPFPVAVGTSSQATEYLSTRSSSSAAWSTQGVQAPLEPTGSLHGERNTATGFTEDLARTLVEVPGPPLSPPGVVDAFVRNNTNGTFQLLATDVGSGRVNFADATPDDSRILFEAVPQLLPAAAAGVKNLYEWDEAKPEGQRLSLAGVLPNAECVALIKPLGCAPPNGSGAGQGGSEQAPEDDQSYLQNTISADGSKVFFTAHPSGRIYERQPLSEPLPLTVPVSLGVATFLAATPSGQYVFYSEGTELYRFDTSTETSQALTSGAEDVLGSLGVSEDGTYAYFVARGVLAPNQNANGEKAIEGADNLYEWHEDSTTSTVTTTFIARLLGGDESDWVGSNNSFVSAEGKTSRLTPSGTALLFMSEASLTDYDNGHEFFLYNAAESLSTVNPVCVSCNPSGIRASAEAHLGQGERETVLRGPTWSSHLTRNLSADGDRVFFETAESLVPQDTNGVSDVYEWEREGVGSCPAGSEHCLYLISTGTAHTKSFFGDASASGNDVFFFTRQPLVGQDDDLNYDVYDARVGGGIPAQNPPPVNHCEGEECKPVASAAPVFGAPGSVALTGGGNLAPPPPAAVPVPPSKKVKCAKGRKPSHGKCVKAKPKKRSRSKKKAKAKKAAARRAPRVPQAKSSS